MPYSGEQKRRYNRNWHKITRDGQCEVMVGVHRCYSKGFYDSLAGRVLCGTHLHWFERGSPLIYAKDTA